MQTLMKDAAPSKVRAQLGRFGFSQDRADVKCGSLSGGEKARLLFALMSRDAPHLMILDEPTNHLDIDSREALVAALNAYEGAVVIISHDPRLIELTADRLWLVADGKVSDFDGDMAAYKALLLNNAAGARRANRAEAKKGKEERKAAAEQRAQLAPLRKQVEEAEKQMAKLSAQKTKLEVELADPKLYNGPAEAITKVKKSLAEVERDLGAAEEAWMTAQEALEGASAASS
jgi:ATP-binding cassette subfamily F protein 3